MNNLGKRVLSSVLYVALFMAALAMGSYSTLAWFAFLTVLCLWEFYQLFKSTEHQPLTVRSTVLGLVVFAVMATENEQLPWKPILITFIIGLFLFELFRKRSTPIQNIAISLLGVIYLAVPLALLYRIAFFTQEGPAETFHPEVIFGFFLIVWSNDTAAYFVGSKFGKKKLMPSVSPKKSWEGFWGGVIFGLIIGYINSMLFPLFDAMHWLLMAAVIVIFGSLGDLVESSFKRSLSIKDSSQLIPGHGGILDRLDGVFIAAPMVYAALELLAAL